MIVSKLEITERKKTNPVSIASPEDFHYAPGASEVNIDILNTPNISLYCLDHKNKRAIFIEVPENIDLLAEPFYYHAQYENAICAYTLSYDLLHRLADNITVDENRIVFIYSVGRCGSTLLSSMFNAIDNVTCFSEPDVFAQLTILRDWKGSNNEEISNLINACLLLICNQLSKYNNEVLNVVKFRSFSIEIADLLYKHFPKAKNLFLYRDAKSWLRSAIRAFSLPGNSDGNINGLVHQLSKSSRLINSYLDSEGPITIPVLGTLSWLSVMEDYLKNYEKGIPFKSIQFEDLKTRPYEVMKDICSYCKIRDFDEEKIRSVLNRDSQRNTTLSQSNIENKEVNIPEEYFIEMEQFLKFRETIRSYDFILPDS